MFVNTNTLKNTNPILLLLSLFVLSLVSCSEAEKTAAVEVKPADTTALPPPAIDSVNTAMATETFKGTYNEKPVLFSHLNFQTYTLNMGGQLSSGQLNTERGYGDDRNATVYVLNSDKPKKEQQYFVRTPQGSVYMLDQGRYVVDDAAFEPVKPSQLIPAPVKKAEPVKAVKKKPEAKKRVSKASTGPDSIKKSGTVKKAPAKKISKSKKKKKKPSRKARKKNRKKKAVSKAKTAETPKSGQ